jgi:hypothetical protein
MDLSEHPKESRNEIIDCLCEKMKQGVGEGSVLFFEGGKVFQEVAHESDERPCEQCFDTVSRTIWKA